MLDRISRERFLQGIKYSLITEAILVILFTIIYLLLLQDQGLYPYMVFTLFTGGLLFIISGFIGPGRYQHDFKLLLFSPKIGASYFENVPISSVCVDGINSADIIINDKIVGEIEFEDNINQIIIKRDLVEDIGLNRLWLKSKENGFLSNIVSFTFFDFDKSMSLEQIDEFSSFDDQIDIHVLEQLNVEFHKKITSHMGSLSLGFFFSGTSIMILGYVLEKLLF